MKKILNKIIIAGLCISTVACQKKFVDLDPNAQFTDGVYFKKPSDFKAYTQNFYGYYDNPDKKWYYGILPRWSYDNMDINSDLSATSGKGQGYDIGHGTIVTTNDWDYSGIRSCNILLSKAATYSGTGDISQYIGEAYFFRAFAYFGLLKTFGGVPIITKVLDVNSPDLNAPRNSRYEVVNQILNDLDSAITKLPTEQLIPAADKGRISKWAAESLKAVVELYEGTWEKYVGKEPDGDGTSSGAGTAGYDAGNAKKYFADAAALCQDVMTNGGYAIWNKNDKASMTNASSWYLFNLEDAGSNPGGYDKTSNTEFILYSVFDYTYKQGGINLTWTSWQLYPSRKFVDMPVCKDGLPIEKSPLFMGYHRAKDEFQDRDLRLINYLYGKDTVPATAGTLKWDDRGYGGYGNWKYAVYNYGTAPAGRRADNTESANLPIIRLAEVYLTYAEALYELNGSITDAQLDASINKLRARGGVKSLTNALVNTYGLDMRTEIRRERTVELYREGKRFDDLKRWGILEASLNPSRLGRVVGDASYPTDYRDASGNATSLYFADSYSYREEAVQTPHGMLKAVIIDPSTSHYVSKKHYLYPVPVSQIILNRNLVQNPGY
jgi:starch-binding outer membrane protein, SusD/RagB family